MDYMHTEITKILLALLFSFIVAGVFCAILFAFKCYQQWSEAQRQLNKYTPTPRERRWLK